MATGGRRIISQRPLCLSEISIESPSHLSPLTGYEKLPVVTLEKAVEELIDILPDIQYYVRVAKQNYRYPGDSLTKDESCSIMLYTMSWKPENQCLYFVLNSILISSDRDKLQPWLLYLRLLLNGLYRLPSISRTIYRGIKTDLSQEYIQGKIFVWSTFSSCTRILSVLQSEQFLGTNDTRTMFVIECQSGRDISEHSYFPSEKEVLLLAGTQLKVNSCLHQNDLHIIELEEIQLSEPFLRPIPTPIPSLNDLFIKISNTSDASSVVSFSTVTTICGRSEVTTPIDHSPILTRKLTGCSTPPQYQNLVLEAKIADARYSNELDLKSMKLNDQDMKIVAIDAIRTTTTLRTLILESNKIGGHGIQYLTDQLKQNRTITTINLRYNPVGDKGAYHLSILLWHTTKLTLLDLNKNQITDKGIQYLSNALRENKTLIKLDLSSNRLGPIGIEHICNALKQNFTLTTLLLAFNDVGDLGSQHFRDALRENKALSILDLSHNQIKAQGIHYLTDGLRQNKALTRLSLINNRFGERGLQYINELKKKNKKLKISFQ